MSRCFGFLAALGRRETTWRASPSRQRRSVFRPGSFRSTQELARSKAAVQRSLRPGEPQSSRTCRRTHRRIVFEAVANSPNPESALYVVSASGGPWTRITDGRHWDDKPRWSPNGRTIYFVSGPGGFFNIWGIRFDPDAGKPVGQPFQISKFDSPRLMILRSIHL